jgi:E3 ubiquitin-protein ligase UBR1
MEKHVPEAVRSRRTVLDTTRPEAGESEAGKKRATAKARQEALLRQMKAQQASFVDTFDDGSDEEDAGMDDTEEEASSGTCIVCQEDLTAARPFGNLGMVQPSRFIRRHPDSHNSYLNDVLQTPASLDRTIPGVPGTAFPPPQAEARDAKAGASPNFEGFPAQFTRFGLHVSVCSHMMHLDCFQVYSASIRQRHRAEPPRKHPA